MITATNDNHNIRTQIWLNVDKKVVVLTTTIQKNGVPLVIGYIASFQQYSKENMFP